MYLPLILTQAASRTAMLTEFKTWKLSILNQFLFSSWGREDMSLTSSKFTRSVMPKVTISMPSARACIASGMVWIWSRLDSPSVMTIAILGKSARSRLGVNWLFIISRSPPDVLVNDPIYIVLLIAVSMSCLLLYVSR